MEPADLNFEAHLSSTWAAYFEKQSKNPTDPKVFHEQS